MHPQRGDESAHTGKQGKINCCAILYHHKSQSILEGKHYVNNQKGYYCYAARGSMGCPGYFKSKASARKRGV
jgi:hypothetical protein